MNLKLDHQMVWIANGVFIGLLAATLAGFTLARRVKSDSGKATVENLNARIRSWWIMICIFALSFMIGPGGSMLLFAFISLLALREYVSLIAPVRADHRTLFWSFFVFTPVQYLFWYVGWQGLAVILIPLYSFFFVPTPIVLPFDTAGFLDHAAHIHC